MLHIRLSRQPSADGGSAAASSTLAAPAPKTFAAASAVPDVVTVACPDHLVLAELPVAKSLGVVTSSASPAPRSIGRRSRRSSGERVHFCVCCDFPIAIYGRLIPCEHSFCLACARSDPSCYLCDERIQKIQTIKMMEGIYICAAPHCLKSFLKRSELKSHIHETHADLLCAPGEREGFNEGDAQNAMRPPTTDLQKQSAGPESSTARAPSRAVGSSSSKVQDGEERGHHQPSRDQPPPAKQTQQTKPSPFHVRSQNQAGNSFALPESCSPRVLDKPDNSVNISQGFENPSGGQFKHDLSSFPSYPPLQLPLQTPGFVIPMNISQAQHPIPFNFPSLSSDGQPFYGGTPEVRQQEMAPESSLEQGSVLGYPHAPAALPAFPDNMIRPWSVGLMSVPFEPLQVTQVVPEGFPITADPQSAVPFFHSSFPPVPPVFPLNGSIPPLESDMKGGIMNQSDGKGMLVPIPLAMPLQVPLTLPPPPLFPLQPQQLHGNVNFLGPSDANREGWKSDNRGFGNGPG